MVVLMKVPSRASSTALMYVITVATVSASVSVMVETGAAGATTFPSLTSEMSLATVSKFTYITQQWSNVDPVQFTVLVTTCHVNQFIPTWVKIKSLPKSTCTLSFHCGANSAEQEL